MGDRDSVTLHVEVCQKSESSLPSCEIEKELEKYLAKQEDLPLDTPLCDTVLPSHVKYIRICSGTEEKDRVNILSEKTARLYHVYQVWEESPQVESFNEDNEELPASLNWCLPNASFEGLWESLILDEGVKDRLLSYVQTTLLYSQKQVNAQVVHWNGIVLLHGPPGTGKTSLCKALAQKISIRLKSKYVSSQLIEINSHSLFSKWFSESAKLVLKMFTSVRQSLLSKDHFVCILMDEVESLTLARKSRDTEPSDSIRVVNAVLTQIDQLQRFPNFLILATSNVSDTIDVAFSDRADLKLFIPYPSVWGIYEIFSTCIKELIQCGLIRGNQNDIFKAVIYKRMKASENDLNGIISEIMRNSRLLEKVSCASMGLSGRTLRKIPFLTSTRFVNKPVPVLTDFLETMSQVVLNLKSENDKFFKN